VEFGFIWFNLIDYHYHLGGINMYTVANRLKLKKGFGAKMAPAFITGKELSSFEGFVKVEVNLSTQNEEFDELNVMMFWETLENFEAWRASDEFHNMHKREVSGSKQGESPVISNEVVIAEIVATQLATV
jgi:heme oxygenase (staphylobilin-producing)